MKNGVEKKNDEKTRTASRGKWMGCFRAEVEFVKRTDWVDVSWCWVGLRNVTVLLDEFSPILLRKQSDTVSKNSAIKRNSNHLSPPLT